jgi:hypothetical protein
MWVAVAENPQHSMRQVTRQHSMDPRTMRNLVKKEMGMESRMIVQRLLLTPDAQEMKKERCRKLLSKLKASQPHQVQVFSNENIFTRDVAINHCNFTDRPVTYENPASASLPFPRLL